MSNHDLSNLAAQQLEKYNEASLDDLYQLIGLRLSDVQVSASNGALAELGKFEPTLQTDPQTLALSDDLKEFGKRLVGRMHHTVYELVCAETRAEDRQTLFGYLNLGTLNRTAAVGFLTSLMVTSLGMSPSIAGLVSWAIVNIVLEAGLSVTCEMWGELLAT